MKNYWNLLNTITDKNVSQQPKSVVDSHRIVGGNLSTTGERVRFKNSQGRYKNQILANMQVSRV